MKRQAMILILTLIFAIMLCGTVSATDYTVGPGQTYTTISDAVNAATDGDNIQVNPNNGNPYNEHIIISHKLNLTANGQVTVQPATNNCPFTINSGGSGSTIQGFTITTSGVNSLSGIELISANNCRILNNNITGFCTGIDIGNAGGSNNEISGNTIDSGANSVGYSYGIDLANTLSANNIISKNTIKTTGTGTGESDGIALYGTGQNNIISGNTIYTTHQGTGYSCGVFISESSSNTISGNSMTALSPGGHIYGVYIVTNSNNNKIIGNNMEYPDIGVYNNNGCTGNVVNFNRIITPGKAISNGDPGLLNAQYNWYDSNANPSGAMTGNVNYTPWLILTVTASPSTIPAGSTSQIAADLTHDSAGGVHDPVLGHFPDGISALFTTTLGTINSPVNTLNGKAIATLSASLVTGVAKVSAALDGQLPINTTVNIIPAVHAVTYTYTVKTPYKKGWYKSWRKKWFKSHGVWKFKWRYKWKYGWLYHIKTLTGIKYV